MARVVVAALAATTALAGCGHDASSKAPAASPPPEKASADYVAPVGAIDDLSDVRCERHASGAWSLRARLTNSSKKARTYAVMVAVIKPKTSEVVGQKTFPVTLGPGASKVIEDDNVFAGATKKATCVQVVTISK